LKHQLKVNAKLSNTLIYLIIQSIISFAVFTEDTFAGLTNLEYLYANNAGIVNIDVRAFASIPNILGMDLEGNRLRTVGEEFASLTQLKELLLAQNQVNTVC